MDDDVVVVVEMRNAAACDVKKEDTTTPLASTPLMDRAVTTRIIVSILIVNGLILVRRYNWIVCYHGNGGTRRCRLRMPSVAAIVHLTPIHVGSNVEPRGKGCVHLPFAFL